METLQKEQKDKSELLKSLLNTEEKLKMEIDRISKQYKQLENKINTVKNLQNTIQHAKKIINQNKHVVIISEHFTLVEAMQMQLSDIGIQANVGQELNSICLKPAEYNFLMGDDAFVVLQNEQHAHEENKAEDLDDTIQP